MTRVDRPRKLCIFCGQPGTSREHALPLWISRLFDKTRFEYRAFGRTYFDNEMNTTLNRVCKRCNNEWLSDLETAAQGPIGQMILGQRVELTPTTIQICAKWIVKTAMVFEYVGWSQGRSAAVGTPYFTDAERLRFATNQTMPVNVSIWLSAYRGDYFCWHTAGDLPLPARLPAFDKGEAYVSTFAIGYLAFQMLSLRHKRLDRSERSSVVRFRQNRDWDNLLCLIWPMPSRNVVWPPPFSMNDAWLDVFARRVGPA